MDQPPTPQSPDFSDPLAVLRACQQDILKQCEALEGLPAHISDQGFGAEARSRIGQAVQFFTTTAPQHQQDKESDLYPILNRQSLKLADILFRLRKEQQRLSELWDSLVLDFKKGAELVEDGTFPDRIGAFCNGYRDYIQRENRELLSMAQHILSHRQLEDIGRAMARRRGIRG
jgi:hemerythrin-like domain-containing protein